MIQRFVDVCRRDLVEQIKEFQHRQGGVGACVAMHPSRTGFGLLHRVCREYSQRHGRVEIARDVHQAARTFTGDDVKMRRITPNDGADRHGRVVPLGGQGTSHGDGDLPRAGHPEYIDVIEIHTLVYQRGNGAFSQRHSHGFVESAHDDDDSSPFAARLSGELRHQCFTPVCSL